MEQFTHIAPEALTDNAFKLIGKDWMLITAEKRGTSDFNTMTASWGGIGFLWNKPVAFCFIRPQRYTKEFVDDSDNISLSFFANDYRAALNLCGKVSGRDVDKVKEAGLTPVSDDGTVYFDEARIVLKCRVLYKDDIRKSQFLDASLLSNYQNDDFHTMYICEIYDALTK